MYRDRKLHAGRAASAAIEERWGGRSCATKLWVQMSEENANQAKAEGCLSGWHVEPICLCSQVSATRKLELANTNLFYLQESYVQYLSRHCNSS